MKVLSPTVQVVYLTRVFEDWQANMDVDSTENLLDNYTAFPGPPVQGRAVWGRTGETGEGLLD